jgi:hypothetical protein
LAVTSYKGVTWGDEMIATSKLNQMAQNDQWLFENSPQVTYKANGITRVKGIKIAAGRVLCTKTGTNKESHTVNFGSFFTTGCSPIIVHSMLHYGEVRVHWGHKGIGSRALPDHTGFELLGSVDQYSLKVNFLTRNYYIDWIAIGY